MRHYSEYDQTDEAEVDNLLATQPTASLISAGPQFGIYNPVHDGGTFWLHLHRYDEQIETLRAIPEALLVFQDVLSTIPSHWVDKRYGGAATQYYRCAEYRVCAKLIDDPEQMRGPLQALLDRFQPEQGYAPLDPASKVYAHSFAELVVVELSVLKRRTKWKLGQNRPVAKRREIIAHLRARNEGRDAFTASEVEKTCSLATTAVGPAEIVAVV